MPDHSKRPAFGLRPRPPGEPEAPPAPPLGAAALGPLAAQRGYAVEQRAVPRAPTKQIGRLLLGDRGNGVECGIHDLSIAGAGISVPVRVDLPRTFRLLLIREGLLFDCALVWRQEDRAGLRFTGRHDLRRDNDRAFDTIRSLWKQLASR